jgi:hypothetical protein
MKTTSKKKTIARPDYWLAIALLVGVIPKAPAQEPEAFLEVQVQNGVDYFDDVTTPSQLATSPGITPAANRSFMPWVFIADIVAVNGKPAKGVDVVRATAINLRTNPSPGLAVADTIRGDSQAGVFEIQQADGTPVGSIMFSGLTAGNPPPGAPARQGAGNNAITGGTGAFLGVKGEWGSVSSGTPLRGASMIEDPANRRANGGGAVLFLLHLIPMRRPEVVVGSTGPAVLHSDFSPVTAAKPAKAGEVLIVQATGLGPTVPAIDPGLPFPTDKTQAVNSPVDVTVSSQSAEVINKVGWPGMVDTYRVDFRVPDGTAPGTASIQLAAAWIPGRAVEIPIQ